MNYFVVAEFVHQMRTILTAVQEFDNELQLKRIMSMEYPCPIISHTAIRCKPCISSNTPGMLLRVRDSSSDVEKPGTYVEDHFDFCKVTKGNTRTYFSELNTPSGSPIRNILPIHATRMLD